MAEEHVEYEEDLELEEPEEPEEPEEEEDLDFAEETDEVEESLEGLFPEDTGVQPVVEELDDEEEILRQIEREAVEDERSESLGTRVAPRKPGEFTCSRCFLVKHRSQLADPKRNLCTDCA